MGLLGDVGYFFRNFPLSIRPQVAFCSCNPFAILLAHDPTLLVLVLSRQALGLAVLSVDLLHVICKAVRLTSFLCSLCWFACGDLQRAHRLQGGAPVAFSYLSRALPPRAAPLCVHPFLRVARPCSFASRVVSSCPDWVLLRTSGRRSQPRLAAPLLVCFPPPPFGARLSVALAYLTDWYDRQMPLPCLTKFGIRPPLLSLHRPARSALSRGRLSLISKFAFTSAHTLSLTQIC